jgi:hypothetical protein
MGEHIDGWLLSPQECEGIAIVALYGIASYEQRNGAVAGPVREAVARMDRYARRTLARTLAPQVSGDGSDGREPANPADYAGLPVSAVAGISVAEAASLLGVSAQAVRRFCRTGDLYATRIPATAPWMINPRSAAALAARRAEQE